MEEVSLTETESRYFSDLFICCDVEKTGKVPMLKATELFRTANLSNDVIAEITSIAGIPETALHISRSQFYSCLKLIAAYQASMTLRSELIASSINLPLPRFSWKESPPKSRKNSTGPSSLGSISSGAGGADSTASIEANGVGVKECTSRREWREVRSPDLIELARAPHIQLDTTASDPQSTDSEVDQNDTNSSRTLRGSPEAWSTNSDSPTPTNSVAERPWAKETLWHGLLGDEHRQLLGTEEESSDRHSSDDDNETDLETIFQITAEQREYYQKQFKAVQPDPHGLVSGHIARVFFEKSRIPVEELRHIWQLCDVTRDGALSLAEFTAAMHLVVLRRNNIELPSVLPACLHPDNLNHSTDPPEADLLHLNDDEDRKTKPTGEDVEFKRMSSRSTKNVMNLSALSTSSQASTGTKSHGTNNNNNNTNSSSPPAVKNRSISSSPSAPTEPAGTPPLPLSKPKDLPKDWANQSREWTKFTESPTSNVSSPGPKPVNFDMQRTAQAVVSDPQILHPVPLRVTPVGAEAVSTAADDEAYRLLRKSENFVLRETETSPKSTTPHHRDSLQNNNTNTDLRAIQRPQPKKLPAKSIGAIPPPPQREPSIGGTSTGDSTDGGSVSTVANGSKKEMPMPPLPPPRPHRHTRSSSLDLNKLKMSGMPSVQPEITAQASFDMQTITDSAETPGFANFANFTQNESKASSNAEKVPAPPHSESEKYSANVPPPPRPTVTSIQSNQRVSAFEVYRKPNTPRNSQSPDTLHQLQPPPLSSSSLAQSSANTSSSAISISSGAGMEYEKRVTAISDTLRHVSFKQEKNTADILRHLREQNVLLLRLCNDLSEELLTVQHRKEEIRSKLESAGTAGISGAPGSSSAVVVLSANVTGGSGSSVGMHSNV